jgi:hypothetical protein
MSELKRMLGLGYATLFGVGLILVLNWRSTSR